LRLPQNLYKTATPWLRIDSMNIQLYGIEDRGPAGSRHHCSAVLAIVEKRGFLNGVPTGIAEGWPEIDRS